MNKKFIELPTNKKTYILFGLILIVLIGLAIVKKSSVNTSILLIMTALGYLLSTINAPITKAKSIRPKLDEDYKKFIERRYGSIRKTNKNSRVIKNNININLGFLTFIFYAIYLLTKITVMDFLLLFFLSITIYIYFSSIEKGIGIISPIYPIFLILPAAIYLNKSPANLFYTSIILGIIVSSIFTLREIKENKLISTNIGGRGTFETIIVIGIITILISV